MAEAIQVAVLGKDHPEYAQTLKNIGSYYQDLKQYDKAITHYKLSSDIFEKSFGKNHMDYASALLLVADINSLTSKQDLIILCLLL